MELGLPEPLASHTQSEELGGHLLSRQEAASGAGLPTEENLDHESQAPAGRESEMGCRNQRPSVFQADSPSGGPGGVRRRRPGGGTEYRCASCGQSSEGTCQGNHTIREEQPWAGGSGITAPPYMVELCLKNKNQGWHGAQR